MTDPAYRANVSDGARWAVRQHAGVEGVTHTAVRPGRRGDAAVVESVEIIRQGWATVYICDHVGVERADAATIAACIAHCDAPADWVAQAAQAHGAVDLMSAVRSAGRVDATARVVVCAPRQDQTPTTGAARSSDRSSDGRKQVAR